MSSISESSALETSDFVPQSEWPNLEELAKGYSEYMMTSSNKLAGTSITLVIDKELKVSHEFHDATSLTWRVLEGPGAGATAKNNYVAFEVRRGYFFVDFYKPDYEEQVSIALNATSGQAAVTLSGFHMQKDEKRTWTKILDAYVEGGSSSKPFPTTEELIGKHIMYRYTPRDVYEHIYFNKGTFTWHCLSGPEKGLADTEQCKMLKLDEKLYLLFWTETIMPVESVIIVDLEKMRSTGRFFCWDPKPQRNVRMNFGSYATILSETNPIKVLKDITSSTHTKGEVKL